MSHCVFHPKTEELALPDVKGLEVYTDAGFAPMKSTGRRSVFRYLFHLSTVFDEVFQQAPVSCDAFLL